MQITAVWALTAGVAWGGSIWSRADRSRRNPYRDDKAGAIGDIVTIVVNERSSIDTDSSRSLEKSDARSVKTEAKDLDLLRFVDAATGKLFSLPDLDISSEAESEFEGETEMSARRSVVDEITVVVEDVLPNGNLVVLGKRTRTLHGETETIQVSGMMRPSDITYDNKIPSSRVANFHLVYRHKGRENQFTRPGWLAEILNFLNPF
jgi:flagellar L-ring protein precursor FlgH